MTIDDLLASSKSIQPVSREAALSYMRRRSDLTTHVNVSMERLPSIHALTGGNPLSLMESNHENHSSIMKTAFLLNDYAMLAMLLPWVYRAYTARWFQLEYFPIELRAWQSAVRDLLEPDYATEICAVYDWMIAQHEMIATVSHEAEVAGPAREQEPWHTLENQFVAALITGGSDQALDIARKAVQTADDIASFYLNVAQPAMYDIGRMWERNQLSVAMEHFATSTVARIMSALYMQVPMPLHAKGNALVTSAPNEFHELGGRMVADLLELDGWNVTFLGANTPTEDLIALAKVLHPFIIAISVAMPFNVDGVQRTIASIRDTPELASVRIMVGGMAFSSFPSLVHLVGADGFGSDGSAARVMANEWWGSRQHPTA